jgi:hypothetical protein
MAKPCNPQEAFSSRKIASLTAKRAPCLPNRPLSVAVKASSMSPVVPGRRFDATVPGGGSKGGHYIGTYGRPPMSPLRCPAKARVLRSLIVVSVRLV